MLIGIVEKTLIFRSFLFVITLSLASCGSGSSDSNQTAQGGLDSPTATSGIGMPDDFSIFQEDATNAATKYNGTADENSISDEALPLLITNTLFGAFADNNIQLNSSNAHYQWLTMGWGELLDFPDFSLHGGRPLFPQPGTRTCDNQNEPNGNKTIRQAAESFEFGDVWAYEFTYDRCSAGVMAFTFTGQIKLIFVRKRNGTLHEVLFSFNDVTLKRGGNEYQVNGVVKTLASGVCGASGDKIFYLNIEDTQSGETVFLENYRIGRRPDSNGNCIPVAKNNNYFSGRILNSAWGAFNVSTKKPLGDEIRTVRNDTNSSGNRAHGEVLITSANTEAAIGISTADFLGYDTDPETVSNTASVTSGSRSRIYKRELFLSGAFMDMADSDNDGMENSWEILTGLDKDNADDALADHDDDGRSNLLEFQSGGSPNNPRENGNTVDRFVNVEFIESDQNSVNIKFNFTSMDEFNRLYVDSSEITITPSSPGDWTRVPNDCYVDGSNAVVCPVGYDNRVAYFQPENKNGPVEFDFRVPVKDDDFNPANNHLLKRIDFVFEDYDLTIEAPNEAEGEVGVLSEIKAFLNYGDYNFERPVYAYIEVPPEIYIHKAFIGPEDDPSPRQCDNYRTHVLCGGYTTGSSLPLQLKLQMKPTSAGNHEIVFGARQEANELRINNNIGRTMLNVIEPVLAAAAPDEDLTSPDVQLEISEEAPTEAIAETPIDAPTEAIAETPIETAPTFQPVETLQKLIDDAVSGSILELPPGNFNSGLNLKNKTLHIKGADGVLPTKIIMNTAQEFGVSDPGSQSIIEGIHFEGAGAPIVFNSGDFLTIANNLFTPLNGRIYNNRVLVTFTYPTEHDVSSRDASYRFIGNSVKGFGVEDNNRCGTLLHAKGWRDTFFERNVFESIRCTNGLIGGFDPGKNDDIPSENIVFTHNTVIDVDTVFGLSERVPGQNHNLFVANNIFSEVEEILPEDIEQHYLSTASTFAATNNIMFNTEYSTFLEQNSIELDPLLLTSDNSSVLLRAGSPAIDAGSIERSYPHAGDSIISPTPIGFPFVEGPVATDGDEDGDVEVDIGSNEFRP